LNNKHLEISKFQIKGILITNLSIDFFLTSKITENQLDNGIKRPMFHYFQVFYAINH